MSANKQSVEGSNVNKESTVADATVVMRRAENRQKVESDPDPKPISQEISGDFDTLFDDDGMIPRVETDDGDTRFHMEAIRESVSEDSQSVEEWLADADPQKLKAIDAKTDGGTSTFIGDTREDLIEHHAKRLIAENTDKSRDEVEFSAPITADGEVSNGLVMEVREEQEPDINRYSTMEDITMSLDDDDSGATCPECGSNHVSSYQQQTGGADEGMTSFNKCVKCGKSWRGGYGA